MKIELLESESKKKSIKLKKRQKTTRANLD